jgi:hypothetical protein
VPYVFTSYRDAARYIGLGAEETMFLTVRVAQGTTLEDVRGGLSEHLPQADVLTNAQFRSLARNPSG